jgi:hypothetical protein
MRVLRNDSAVSFNIWTSQWTWFWSLIYPDGEGGAIGAATSEAEALHEVHAAIERLPQQRDTITTLVAHYVDSKFIQRCPCSNNSQAHNGGRIGVANGEFVSSRAAHRQRADMPTGEGYRELWQLAFQQYVARVANA